MGIKPANSDPSLGLARVRILNASQFIFSLLSKRQIFFGTNSDHVLLPNSGIVLEFLRFYFRK